MNNSAQKSSSTDLLAATVMTKLWKRMVAIYGYKWSSHLGDAMDGIALSEAAKTWQAGLVGVTVEQLGHGLQVLIASGNEWPPSLIEFRKLCLSNAIAEVPTLDEIVSTLVTVSTRQGSLARRYRHPMALAVSLACHREGIDMFAIRNAKLVDAKRMIKPAYEHCLSAGWNDWTEAELEEPDSRQKALGHDKPVNKSAGRSFFSEIKSAL